MNISLLAFIVVIVILALLVIFIVIRNRKDEKELTEKLNEDYKKPKSTHSDIEIEDRQSI